MSTGAQVIDYKQLAGALKSEVADEIKGEVADQIKAALAQFSDSAKVRSAGMVTPDGGAADPEVKSMADWLTALVRNDEKRLRLVYKSIPGEELERGEGGRKALAESNGSTGGWTVPTEFNARLLESAGEASIVDKLPAGRKPMELPMSSRTLTLPTLDQSQAPSTGGSGFDAGVYAAWTEESGAIPSTEPKFGSVELNAHKLSGYTVASNELNSDSAIALEALLVRLFGRAIGRRRSYSFLKGNGVGKPLGVFEAPARLGVTRGTGAANVETADVLSMLQLLPPGSEDRAVWMAHPFLRAELAGLTIGTSSNAVVWGNIQTGTPTQLLGVPLLFGEHMAAPGQPGDLMLVDWSYYLVGNRGATVIAMSEHARFLNDDLTWRFTHRVEGQPWLKSKITLADGAGTNYVSPYVYLN